MVENRGKQFEGVIRKAFTKVPETNVIRIPDQTNGFRGAVNICDFVVYHYPYQYCIECKSVHGNTLPLRNLEAQRGQLLKASKIDGVVAGVMCWWINKNVTKFLPIQAIEFMREQGYKSIRYDMGVPADCEHWFISIKGSKKRVFFDYDMKQFFEEVACGQKDRRENQ